MTKNHTSSAVKFLSLVFLFTLTSFIVNAQLSTDPAVVGTGKSLFDANCKACHRVKVKLVGPALAGVYDRVPSLDWIKNFVKNSSKVIASGDEYANKIYAENNKTQMTAFTSLKDDQIMAIISYVKTEADKPDAATPASATAAPGAGGGEGVPSAYLNVILVGMVLILVLLLIVLGFLISAMKRFLSTKDLSEEEKDVVNSPYTFSSVTSSSAFIFIVAFIVAALGFKAVINGLFSIGVQQGYSPKQPIAFSHKLHAGQMEIDCKYCHTGVMKGKSANIPSPNICMNCHNQVKSGSKTGETEIAKIAFAYENNKPIEWVRIHNLPDLAYFNHSQHVNVAGVECETCHGPIKEMEVVHQHSLLTMGWCIDCHRKTDVNTKGNAYYDKLVELHKTKSKENMKVEDIGGLECGKCHY